MTIDQYNKGAELLKQIKELEQHQADFIKHCWNTKEPVHVKILAGKEPSELIELNPDCCGHVFYTDMLSAYNKNLDTQLEELMKQFKNL